MQIEKYSDRLKTLIQSAQTLALRGGHQQLTPLHVLKALLEDQEQLYATQDAQVTSTLTRCLADISLFKALGGNWQEVAL